MNKNIQIHFSYAAVITVYIKFIRLMQRLSFLTQLKYNARVDISSCSEIMFMRRFKPIFCRKTFKYKDRRHEFLYFPVSMCLFL